MVHIHRNVFYAAMAVVAIILIVLTLSAYRFNTFQNGVCSIVSQSSQGAANNREYYLGNVRRARVRLKVDQRNNDQTLVSADQDAITANLRNAARSKPFRVPGC